MARIRSIKPEFWTSGQVLECSLSARLLFIGMWNFADDTGRLPNSAKSIKAQVFPADDLSIETIRGMIVELSKNDLLREYAVEGKEYLEITGWKHQRIDKPQASKYPAPVADHSATIPRTIPPDKIRKEEIRKEEHCPAAKATRTKNSYSEEFENKFWQPYPRSPTMSKSEAWKEWIKIDPDQRSAACQAIEPYRRFLRTKPNLETVHACRFLSQKRFEGFLAAGPAQPSFDIRSHIA